MTSARLLILALTLTASLVAGHGATRASNVPVSTGYWHTSGTRILDAGGHAVRISGVNWYGMAGSSWVPGGLDFQRYTTIMDEVKLLGYNTIRLPFSNELVERDPVVTQGVAANPELRGKRAMQVMDAIVAYAQQIGLKIILDDHRSRAARPMEVNSLYEPLWYTARYPEVAWIRDWQTLALRYRGSDAVIGVDLRNEPHPTGPGPWSVRTYLQQGPTWGPYGGVDNPATDWRLAAERAGNAVLAVNPRLLVIVEGLQLYPQGGKPGGVAASWWAGILTPVKRYPVQLNVPHQLVYSVHEWGPRKHAMPWFTPLTYASLRRAWHESWSFLLDSPNAPYAAPLLLGEFGTCNDSVACVESGKGDGQGTWFQLFLRFLREHPEIGWSYFALNGTNSNDCRTDNGLLNAAWNALSSPSVQTGLRSDQAVPAPIPPLRGPLVAGAITHRKPTSPRSPLCQLP